MASALRFTIIILLISGISSISPAAINKEEFIEQFHEQQKKWCGRPSVPITFPSGINEFKNASRLSWPWMVSLYQVPSFLPQLIKVYLNSSSSITNEILEQLEVGWAKPGHACGGSLISSDYVLTAAHCPFYREFRKPLDNFIGEVLHFLIKKCNESSTESESDCRERLEVAVNTLPNRDAIIGFKGVSLNDSTEWEIWVGAHMLPNSENLKGNENVQMLKVKKIITPSHTKALYPSGLRGDIALLQLDRPVQFNDALKPICLTNSFKKPHPVRPSLCSVAGWGVYHDKEGKLVYPIQLMDAQYQVQRKCHKTVRDYPDLEQNGIKKPDKKTQFCALEASPMRKKIAGAKTKICYGDSGGPLICKFDNGRWYQIGISSFGRSSVPESCENPGSPDVFTSVPGYHEWIMEEIWKNT